MYLDLIEAVASSLGVSIFTKELLIFLKEKLSEKKEALPGKVESVEDVEKIKQVLMEENRSLSPGESKRLALDFVESTYSTTYQIRQERLRQARTTFNLALTLTIIGVVIIFIGLLLFYLGNISAGIIIISVGAVCEIFSSILFKLNKDSNDRLDETAKELSLLDKLRTGIQYISEITDSEKRDEAIRQFIMEMQSRK